MSAKTLKRQPPRKLFEKKTVFRWKTFNENSEITDSNGRKLTQLAPKEFLEGGLSVQRIEPLKDEKARYIVITKWLLLPPRRHELNHAIQLIIHDRKNFELKPRSYLAHFEEDALFSDSLIERVITGNIKIVDKLREKVSEMRYVGWHQLRRVFYGHPSWMVKRSILKLYKSKTMRPTLKALNEIEYDNTKEAREKANPHLLKIIGFFEEELGRRKRRK